MSARFQVATCSGWWIGATHARRGGPASQEGLSATVCDTVWNWRELATYRSEDRVRGPGRTNQRLGRDGALAAARDHARYLNRLYDAA